MDQLLGFIVLTSPLFLIAIWLLVSLILVIWLGRKIIKTRWKRVVLSLPLFLLILILPVSDLIIDRVYLYHLCETEGGYRVYNTMELPEIYWDEDGTPIFMDDAGGLNLWGLEDKLGWNLITESFPNAFTKMEKNRFQLINKSSNKVLGEKVTFQSAGGWIEDFSPSPGRGASCGRGVILDEFGHSGYTEEAKLERKQFVLDIFKQLTNTGMSENEH